MAIIISTTSQDEADLVAHILDEHLRGEHTFRVYINGYLRAEGSPPYGPARPGRSDPRYITGSDGITYGPFGPGDGAAPGGP